MNSRQFMRCAWADSCRLTPSFSSSGGPTDTRHQATSNGRRRLLQAFVRRINLHRAAKLAEGELRIVNGTTVGPHAGKVGPLYLSSVPRRCFNVYSTSKYCIP